jgi:archaemetzincin
MEKIVYIQPLGYINTRLIGKISASLCEYMETEVKILPKEEIIADSFNTERKQFNSTILLDSLLSIMKATLKGSGKIIGIIDEDIYSPVFEHIFGEAQIDSRAGIVSLKRLREEFYGMPRNTLLMEERIFKEMAHEAGHLYGLTHCCFMHCIMAKSTNIRDLDRKSLEFCRECFRKLKENKSINS